MSTARLHKRWPALALLACGVIAVVVAGIRCVGRARELSTRLVCAANLKAFYTAWTIYGAEIEADQCPRLDDAATTECVIQQLIERGDLTLEQTVCPRSGKPYVLNLRPPRDGVSYAGYVVAYEPLSYHDGEGANVLYADGHCSFERREAYLQLFDTNGPSAPGS